MAVLDKPGSAIPPSRPMLFVDYYAIGLQLGIYALERLRADLEELERSRLRVPERLLWQLVELGAKLAVSQASVWGRSSKPEATVDELEGFRKGAAPLPSQRFGNSRVRVLNGDARPVNRAVQGGRDDDGTARVDPRPASAGAGGRSAVRTA